MSSEILAFILILMIFFHIVDDYYLQGILSKMKQSSWWKENAPEPLYKYDYIVALIMHAFSWSFMIMLPWIMFTSFTLITPWIVLFLINVGVHALVDHLKANMKKINLVADQGLHLIQILLSWTVMMLCL